MTGDRLGRERPESSNALADVAIVLLAIGVAWIASRFWLYPMLGIPDYVPLILRPILGFLVAWWLLRRSGRRWAEFGLSRPRNPAAAALVAAGLFGVVWVVLTYAAPAIASVVGARAGPSFISQVRGNAVAFAFWLAVAWIVGGFIEELLFRGFFLDSVARIVGRGSIGPGVGVVSQALLFGLLHLYQGSLGFVMAGLFALVYGIAYLVTGRNLWPLILVHGTWNSVGIVTVYLTPGPAGGG